MEPIRTNPPEEESGETSFAPAGRATAETIRAQSRTLLDIPLLEQLYDAVMEAVVILNRERQIVFANRRLSEMLGIEDQNAIYGLRPGEILQCVHAENGSHGCGTSGFCRNCGAIAAILCAQKGEQSVEECRIQKSGTEDVLDLRVRTSPFSANGEEFTIFAITDISHEKRRRALENIFFHDIKNIAGGIKLFSELLREDNRGQVEYSREVIQNAAARLLEEIDQHRDLMAAENHQLELRREPIDTRHLLEEIAALYRGQEIARERKIRIALEEDMSSFVSDRNIVTRILENMLKNALEASRPGETVTIAARRFERGIELRVHNPGFIPEEVQSRIFGRSFSTKGEARGLGTYSMKLLGERYLKGSVSFTSAKGRGTTFLVRFPTTYEAGAQSA